ncbi:uncharacterized protein LOC144665316 [Oculina patagonica]
MATTQLFCITLVLQLCQMFCEMASQQCEGEDSIYGMMLRGHTFKRMKTSISLECLQACYDDVRCQSFNYVISQDLCELNDRTKEARPEDFVPDSDRYYYRKFKKRVPLGSIPELPANSCTEIKANEGGQVVSGKYWFDSIILGQTVLAHCNMETEDVDECSASNNVCDVNAVCVNTIGSFGCSCKIGYSGDGQRCELLPCKPVGVADVNKMPDDKITSSTVYLQYYSYHGRLHGVSGWCPSTKTDRNDFIQVDMGAVRAVCAVATQGKPNGSFVTSYKLLFSADGARWSAYKEDNVDKVFQANADLESVVQNSLNITTHARYVRFYPVTYSSFPCMRIEVFVQ